MAAFWCIDSTEGEDFFCGRYPHSRRPYCCTVVSRCAEEWSPLLLFDLNIRQRVREEKLKINGGDDQPLADLFCWMYSCSKVLLATVLQIKRNTILFFHWRQLK
jgi:hypothetical protein